MKHDHRSIVKMLSRIYLVVSSFKASCFQSHITNTTYRNLLRKLSFLDLIIHQLLSLIPLNLQSLSSVSPTTISVPRTTSPVSVFYRRDNVFIALRILCLSITGTDRDERGTAGPAGMRAEITLVYTEPSARLACHINDHLSLPPLRRTRHSLPPGLSVFLRRREKPFPIRATDNSRLIDKKQRPGIRMTATAKIVLRAGTGLDPLPSSPPVALYPVPVAPGNGVGIEE